MIEHEENSDTEKSAEASLLTTKNMRKTLTSKEINSQAILFYVAGQGMLCWDLRI
jgi:hypothetical protein